MPPLLTASAAVQLAINGGAARAPEHCLVTPLPIGVLCRKCMGST